MKLSSLLLRAAAVLPLAGGLYAGTIESNTVNFDLTPGMFNNVALSSSFTPFNTALGTLTQVEVIATGNLTATVELDGVGAGAFSLFGSDSFGAGLTLGGDAIEPTLFYTGTGLTCNSIGNVEVSSCDTGAVPWAVVQTPDDVVAPPMALGLFTTGSNVSFLLAPTDFSGAPTQTGNGTVNSSFNGFTGGPEIKGDIYLLYTYTPNAQTPEPSSMALIGAGLTAVAWVARRRQFFRYLARKA